jgi:hypothetical protein
VIPIEALLVVGAVLALVGVGRVLFGVITADEDRQFAGYLVVLLLVLLGVGLLLATAL